MKNEHIKIGKISKLLLLSNGVIAIIYFSWWFDIRHSTTIFLYGLLFFGEVYHVTMAVTFWLNLWPNPSHPRLFSGKFTPSIDIYITVAGEPYEIIVQTAQAAKKLKKYAHEIYLLNDGFASKKENWQDVEVIASQLGIHCITRKKSKGAKAGNINNALRQTTGDIICIFDADMVAHPDFLEKIIPYFKDSHIGFVQSPQYYKNFTDNDVTRVAWEQQSFFYGPILQGKEKDNAVFICGTNVAIRRNALEQVGGMCEDTIAEDFLTSLFIHQKGWKSLYVTEVLAEGLAPHDLSSYYKQQLRWARGSLEVLFSQNPFFKKGLTFRQRVHYLSSALYYFNGIIVLIDISLPLIFLFTRQQAVVAATTTFAIFFVPFMFLNLYTLYLASEKTITFRAIAFSQSLWILQLQAIVFSLFHIPMKFSITSKKAEKSSSLHLAIPHLLYIFISVIAISVGLSREGLNPAMATNISWIVFNILLFLPFIRVAYPWNSIFARSRIVSFAKMFL